jgi:hypothetical protein
MNGLALCENGQEMSEVAHHGFASARRVNILHSLSIGIRANFGML